MAYLWKILAKTQLKFKIIEKVLFKYPEDEDEDMDIDIEPHRMSSQDLQEKIKLYRYQKELDRMDRQRRAEVRKNEDELNRQIKLKKQQELIELRRREFQQAKSGKSSFKFPPLKLKNLGDKDENIRENRKISRQQQKKLRKQQIRARSRIYNSIPVTKI